MTEREFAIEVVRRLREAGHEALWAGGCVRDELLGLSPQDYDVATSAHPEAVRKLFRRSSYRTVAVGMSFGVIEVLGPKGAAEDLRVQVATFRSDGGYSDGRHPDTVVFSSAREDALRRDFTINGMFFDPLTGSLIDYVGGQEDLQAGLLRAIGDPAQRFDEDKLRMLRAVRIATRFQLSLDDATAAALRRLAGAIKVVSAERIAEELRKLLVDANRAAGVKLMDDVGLTEPILPELLPLKDLPAEAGSDAHVTIWQHVLMVLELIGEEASFPLAAAALLHDVGKPSTASRQEGRLSFHYHESAGRQIARTIATRLKLSNSERERIEWLVEKHSSLCDARQLRVSKLKMMLAHPGIEDLLRLHRANAMAGGRSTDHVEFCEAKMKEWSPAELNPPQLLTGDDLTRMGLTPGPHYRRLLEAVREAQLEGTLRVESEAREFVKSLLEEKG